MYTQSDFHSNCMQIENIDLFSRYSYLYIFPSIFITLIWFWAIFSIWRFVKSNSFRNWNCRRNCLHFFLLTSHRFLRNGLKQKLMTILQIVSIFFNVILFSSFVWYYFFFRSSYLNCFCLFIQIVSCKWCPRDVNFGGRNHLCRNIQISRSGMEHTARQIYIRIFLKFVIRQATIGQSLISVRITLSLLFCCSEFFSIWLSCHFWLLANFFHYFIFLRPFHEKSNEKQNWNPLHFSQLVVAHLSHQRRVIKTNTSNENNHGLREYEWMSNVERIRRDKWTEREYTELNWTKSTHETIYQFIIIVDSTMHTICPK